MCIVDRAAQAGILRRAVDILLDSAAHTTHQMRSMQGQMRAKLQKPKRRRTWR